MSLTLDAETFFVRAKAEKDIYATLLLVVFGAAFACLFNENLLFRDCNLIANRVDDAAYAASMKQSGQYLLDLNVTDFLFQQFSYGYGWLFWCLSGLITLPFTATDAWDWFMVSPRMASLCLVMGGCYFTYKIIGLYTKHEITRFFAMLSLLVFPALPWIAMRTGTDAGEFFFNSLAFYLAAKQKGPYTHKQLLLIAIPLAMSAGFKVSAALFAPLVCLTMAEKEHWQVNVQTAKKAAFFLSAFIVLALFMVNPAIVLFQNLDAYTNLMRYYMNRVTVPFPLAGNDISGFWGRYIHGIADGTTLSLWAFIAALLLWLYGSLKRRALGHELLLAFVYLIAVSAYISNHVKMGSYFIVLYFFPISFVLLFAFCGIEKLAHQISTLSQNKINPRVLIASTSILFLAFSVDTNGPVIAKQYLRYYRDFAAYQQQNHREIDTLKDFFDEQETQTTEEEPRSLLVDHYALESVCLLSDKVQPLIAQNNLGIQEGDYDYLVINKKADSLAPNMNLQAIKNETLRNNMKMDALSRQKLLKTSIYKDVPYKVVRDTGTFVLYEKKNP